MDLTAEQFAEILKSLNELSRQPSDKRRAPRVNHRCRALITRGKELHSGLSESVSVRDFSPRGICILCPKPMAGGENFIICMSRRGSSPVHILCTVVHCNAVSKEMHTIGAEFTCVLDHSVRPAVTRGDLARIRDGVLDGVSV